MIIRRLSETLARDLGVLTRQAPRAVLGNSFATQLDHQAKIVNWVASS